MKKEYKGKKIVTVICDYFPEAKPSAILKALSRKNIKVNGKSVKENIIAEEGDVLSIYLNDDVLATEKGNNPVKHLSAYRTIFRDNNILIIYKPQGMPVHPSKNTPGISLIETARRDSGNSDIKLCHRIDMNTGGLLMLAENTMALESITASMKENQIIKRYRCLVKGLPDKGSEVICHDNTKMKQVVSYLEKNSAGSEVFIHENNQRNYKKIITRYRILNVFPGLPEDSECISDIEVELVTGRTHQIRAHMAYLGHPVIGDGKYGRNSFNNKFRTEKGKVKFQQLFATSLHFQNIGKNSCIYYLNGRIFTENPEYSVILPCDKINI